MRKTAVLVFGAAVALAACSTEPDRADTGDTSDTSDTTEAIDSSVTTAEPAEPQRPDELDPFEPVPTTPVVSGADLDDVLRDAATTTTTTLVGDAATPPPRRSLDAGPLGWVTRIEPTPDTSTIQLLVDERDCDGSIDVTDRLAVDVIAEPDRVVIDVSRRTAAPPDRRACPTAPLTPLTVELDVALGERALVAIASADITVPEGRIVEPVAVALAGDTSLTAATTRSTTGPLAATPLACAGESTFAVDWRPTVEYAEAADVLALGADALDLSEAPWHHVVTIDERGSSQRWVAAIDGRIVAVIEAVPAVVGVRAFGESCPPAELRDRIFDSALDTTTERLLTATTADGDAPPLLDLTELPPADSTDLVVDADALRFATASRCAAWIAWEDSLLAAGHTLGPPRTLVDPDALLASTGARATEVDRQVARRIDARDGSAAIVTTTADGRIVAAPAVGPGDPDRPSRLAPCELDVPLAVVVS